MHVANLLLSFLCVWVCVIWYFFSEKCVCFFFRDVFHLRDGGSPVSHSLSFSVLPPPSSWCPPPLSSQVVAPPFSWYFVILPCFVPTCSPCWPFPCRAIWSRRGGGFCCAMMIKLLSAMVNVLDDNRIIEGNGHCHFRLHSPLMLRTCHTPQLHVDKEIDFLHQSTSAKPHFVLMGQKIVCL